MLLTWSALLFGLLRGVGHALEPDHLAAVSTLVAESRGVSRAGLLLGAAWGAGHTVTLVLVGGALFIFRATMPTRVETAFELLVACMLIVLGVRALVRAVREGRAGDETAHAHAHAHAHGDATHVHAAAHEHVHVRGFALARRPLMIGLVHGLAGSGALTAAVVAQLPTPAAGLLYMALFGVGSAAGMAMLSGIAGVPLARIAESRRALPVLLGVSGVVSLAMGVAWGVIHTRSLLA